MPQCNSSFQASLPDVVEAVTVAVEASAEVDIAMIDVIPETAPEAVRALPEAVVDLVLVVPGIT